MMPGHWGEALLVLGCAAAIVTGFAYALALRAGERSKNAIRIARSLYAVTALCVIGTFSILGSLVYNHHYVYDYVFQHSDNSLTGWFRLSATWAGQEGSFLLWAAWTAVIGFFVAFKAGKYEARVMPFFVSILAFLCAILVKQSPFHYFRAVHPDWTMIPPDGAGLSPSLVNYWMTIHPPTIFFGFASLAVPFCYAVAALIWKDYEEWTPRVMPYALLSCGTLGLGLFMGGYWAYETLGWHGFWAWDPVENASFFPWLAITALVHGLVVQRDRGGMARTNTFLGVFAFWLFLLGTFLTRSGALAGEGPDGQILSVHAFDNISKSGLALMVAMLVGYGIAGLVPWLWRLRSMPVRKTTGETLVSRDFAFFTAVLLMIVACIVVTLGATSPLFMGWLHQPPAATKPALYNKMMMPLAILAAFAMGCVPWLAWTKTDPDKFLKRLIVPWFLMLGFGFFLLIWVLGAERAWYAAADMTDPSTLETTSAWISPSVQRVVVITLSSLGFLAALSNAALAYRVFRKKPLAAGGWIAHVGIGLLMIGVIVSNTYERTHRVLIVEGQPAKDVFGYKVAFEKMTGKSWPDRPLKPQYDRENTIQLRVTPPGNEQSSDPEAHTFLINPRWFVYDFKVQAEEDVKTMRWPAIQKYFGHDFYVGLPSDPVFVYRGDDPNSQSGGITLQPGEKRDLGPYILGYFQQFGEPGKFMGVHLVLKPKDSDRIIEAKPVLSFSGQNLYARNVAVPELPDEHGNPGAIYLERLDARTKAATLKVSLPGYEGAWAVPLEVTYKPWVNLVWGGVLIAVFGIFTAMVRRALEARRVEAVVPEAAAKDPVEAGAPPLKAGGGSGRSKRATPTAAPSRRP